MSISKSVTASFSEQLTDERRRVDFDSYDISVQQLLSMVGQDQIDVAPTYQRRFRWDEARQSWWCEQLESLGDAMGLQWVALAPAFVDNAMQGLASVTKAPTNQQEP